MRGNFKMNFHFLFFLFSSAYNNSLYFENSRFIFVRIGSDYTNRHGEVIPVTEIIFHPGFDPATLQNNIAIIRIMKIVKFSKKRKIQRIKYNSDGDLADDYNSVTILGWGAKDVSNPVIEESEEMNMKLIISTYRLRVYLIYLLTYLITDK